MRPPVFSDPGPRLGARAAWLRNEDALPDDPAPILPDEFQGAQNVQRVVDAPLHVLKVHGLLLLPVNVQDLLRDVAPRGILALAHQFQHRLREEDQLLRLGDSSGRSPRLGCAFLILT